jgi:hypothetical protein
MPSSKYVFIVLFWRRDVGMFVCPYWTGIYVDPESDNEGVPLAPKRFSIHCTVNTQQQLREKSV